MGELEVNFENLNKMFAAMNEVGDQAWHVSSYFSKHVCDASGFGGDTCCLHIIGDQLKHIDGWFDDMRLTFNDKWSELQGAIAWSAQEVDRADGDINEAFTYYRGHYGGPHSPPTPPEGYLENYHLEDVQALLVDPEEGGEELNHNNKFDAAAEAWEVGRDTINWGIDLLNGLGAGITRLDEASLRDYIVFPLSGDYGAIRTNANACGVVNTAMSTWGGCFTQLALKTPQALDGQASYGLIAQLGTYDIVMKAVGLGVSGGTSVFNSIATMSEKIAVEVEDVLVILGEKILKLASKVTSRFVPGLGWALLALDLLRDGFGVVQDIIDDIETVRTIITECQNLVDEVTSWAEVQAGRLDKFQDIVDTVTGLPGVTAGVPGLNGVVALSEQAEAALDDVVTFGEDTSEELGGLEESLNDLDNIDIPDEAQEAPDDDEDMLMAPGPLDGTYDDPSTSTAPVV
ncbi:hypothetical protein FE634_20700 [Nocardioides dongxiaopingii]|uniref:hypothetical protein n=1 Tax=Nocardioides TaxID=1839 RepID=UPI0010C76C0F|nr:MULTISPECIES: hypothetical protein [Nocardioides]QCW52241.2 hypothetical protein FE634_20700 [Nocardioides sp. S-1144]